MKHVFTGLALVMMSSTLACAQDGGFGTFSGNVAATSDYIFRGYSQSDKKPAVQPALNWDSGAGVHLNFWGSNIDFNDGGDASVEVDQEVQPEHYKAVAEVIGYIMRLNRTLAGKR